MTNPTIRIYQKWPDGTVEDMKHEYEVSDFGGVVPIVGDIILSPGVDQGLRRDDPANRTMWHVVKRVLNPRDNKHYVALVVEEKPVADDEFDLAP